MSGHLLDHHALESVDIDADVDFFRRAVGMRLIRWGTHVPTGRRIAMLADGGIAKIELIEVESVTGEWAHTAFLVPDVAVAHDTIVRDGAGAQAVAPFRLAPAKAYCSLLTSASGRALQLIAYDADSPDLLAGQTDSYQGYEPAKDAP